MTLTESATRGSDSSAAERTPFALCAGTFLICFSLLAFEISTVRTISFAIGQSFIYVAIAIAMLGLTAAGSVLSLFDLNKIKAQRGVVLFWACIAIALLLVIAQFLVASNKQMLNELVEAAGREGGLKAMLPILLFDGFRAALKIGFFLCLPYFLFGGLLSYLFATSKSHQQGKLYAADLIGAAAGCIGAVVVMETTGFALSVTVPAIVAALAAVAFVASYDRKFVIGGLATAAALWAAPLVPAYEKAIEPPADPHFLVRDYEYERDLTETWRRWNSYSRVGAVEDRDHEPPYVTLSLDNGSGMARLWPFETDRPNPYLHPPAIPAFLLGPAEDMLVLFAGAGADLMSARENGFGRVTGVELNHTIIEAARELKSYRFEDFAADPNVQLTIAEGRGFLEQDQNSYDVVLMSWSGATAVYYLGALGGTTQYLFTYEGISSILDHVKPTGYAVVLQANKIKMLAALRRYLDERALPEPAQTAIILFKRDTVHEWNRGFDDNPLLIKPSGWSEDEIETVLSNAAKHGYEVAYAPGHGAHPDYAVYERMLRTSDVAAELAALRAETNLRFDIVTDDRPFYIDLFENSRYLSGDFWLGPARGTLENTAVIYHFFRVMIVILIGIAAFTLSVAPLLLGNRPTSKSRATTYLAYFLCLGAGFMFLEIGILQKGSLLFGDPSLTISLVLGAIILFTGIGSLISNWSFRHGFTFRLVATLVVVYIIATTLLIDPILYTMITWSTTAKALMLSAVIAPGAILMGHLFPQGLALARDEDATLVPWAWAVNGAMSAFVAGLAPLVAQAFGFQALFLTAAVLYAAVIFLPIALPAREYRLADA